MSRAVSDLGDLSDLNGLSQLSTAAHTAIGFKLSGGSYQSRTLGHSGRSMISVARVSHIFEVAHLVALSATRSLRSPAANAQGTLATILHSPTVTAPTGCAKMAASAHDDFTDLDDRRLVGVLWDVRHNLRSVSPKTGLEFLNRLAENVAHPHVRSGSAGRSARKALVHGVVLARFTQSIFHEGHVLVPVIVVVEAGARHICIHNTYLNHDLLLIDAARFSSGDKDEPCVRFARPATWKDRQVGIHSCGQSRRGDRRFAAQSTMPPTQAAWLSCCCSGRYVCSRLLRTTPERSPGRRYG